MGVINIIYGALSAFGQDNIKRRLAYYSISHMGFVLVGIASLTELGINAAVLQMISHGLIAAMLSSFFPLPPSFFPLPSSAVNFKNLVILDTIPGSTVDQTPQFSMGI